MIATDRALFFSEVIKACMLLSLEDVPSVHRVPRSFLEKKKKILVVILEKKFNTISKMVIAINVNSFSNFHKRSQIKDFSMYHTIRYDSYDTHIISYDL